MILCLQETHLGSNNDKWRWSREWDGKSFWTTVSSNSKGVAILLNRNCSMNVRNEWSDDSGRIISIQAEVREEYVNVLNIHASNVVKWDST